MLPASSTKPLASARSTMNLLLVSHTTCAVIRHIAMLILHTEDILRARLRTVGVEEHRLCMESRTCTLDTRVTHADAQLQQ